MDAHQQQIRGKCVIKRCHDKSKFIFDNEPEIVDVTDLFQCP